jgi:hypothetical protein
MTLWFLMRLMCERINLMKNDIVLLVAGIRNDTEKQQQEPSAIAVWFAAEPAPGNDLT